MWYLAPGEHHTCWERKEILDTCKQASCSIKVQSVCGASLISMSVSHEVEVIHEGNEQWRKAEALLTLYVHYRLIIRAVGRLRGLCHQGTRWSNLNYCLLETSKVIQTALHCQSSKASAALMCTPCAPPDAAGGHPRTKSSFTTRRQKQQRQR